MEHAVGIYVPFASIIIASQKLTARPELFTQLKGLGLAVEKTVRPPFTEVLLVPDAPDLASRPPLLLQNLNVQIDTLLVGFSLQIKCSGKP
jgi:hypothetical protein